MAYTTVDDPTIYFNTVLYTGNGSNGHGITGVGFQPDWIWIKGRSVAENHNVYDSVRGAGIRLIPNTGSNDTTKTDTQKSFDSDGFTLDSGAEVNDNSQTFVSWNWKAGTSFSNSGGSNGADLASSGTFNRTAGFSIVTFTGNATANQQIYHGLNSVPKWMVLKNRTNTNNESWCVYHQELGNTKKLTLDTTATATTNVEFWQDTTPTSTVLTVGRQDAVNGSGNTHVVYCFSEIQGYSKFGQYIGNGNADGTFIYTGFKPAWFMIKSSSNAEAWEIGDNKRDTENVVNNILIANSSGTETAGTSTNRLHCDFVSNGVKLRGTASQANQSGSTYIYMAFAESPFVNSNGIPNNAG